MLVSLTSEVHQMNNGSMRTATLTDFLRTPKEVIAQVETGAVRISRRDGEDLVLLRAGDLDMEHEGIALASQIMRASLRHPGDFGAALCELFPWTALLSESEMSAYVADMNRLVWSAAELGEYALLLAKQRSWEGTAEIYAAGLPTDLGQELDWTHSPVEVGRPSDDFL